MLKKQLAFFTSTVLLLSLLAGCTPVGDADVSVTQGTKPFDISATEPTVTEPAAVPTTRPSVPTTAPTVTEPTIDLTRKPTTEPTAAPTTAPTTEPTTAPTTEPTTEPTTAPTTAPTEPLYDQPEVLFSGSTDNIYVEVTVSKGGTTQTMRFGHKIVDGLLVLFVDTNMEGLDGMVIEENENGTYALYAKPSNLDFYMPVSNSNPAQLESMITGCRDIIAQITTYEASEFRKLRKIADDGDFCSYEIVNPKTQQVLGSIQVDKATGLLTEREENGSYVAIQTIDLNNARIPKYKN